MPQFFNPPGSPKQTAGPRDFIPFFARRVGTSFTSPKMPEGHVLPRDEALAQFNVHTPGDSITWLGHAAFLIRAGETSILIDPFLSRRAGPGLFGPPRFAAPQIGVGDFGPLDALLISHNHYDHLDAQTLRNLPGRDSVQTIAPLGLKPLLSEMHLKRIREVGWYDTVETGNTRITSVPAIHWSKRGPADENTSWWCGYIIEWEGGRIWFSGDTAAGPVFAELGSRWDDIDLGIIGIGAYEPQAIMKPVHTNPEEAIQIAQDIHCKNVLGMHWGTIILSDEDPWEPPVRFRTAGESAGYAPEQLWTMAIGETRPLTF